MIDRKLILSYLCLNIPNDHPAIYLYSAGLSRSRQTAIKELLLDVKSIFDPIPEKEMVDAVKFFLEEKKNAYKNGDITIKPLY